MPLGVTGATIIAISCPWTSDARSSLLKPYAICHHSNNAAYWDLLETEALTGSETMTLCIHLPIMPWIMEVAPCKFHMATKASFLKWKWYIYIIAKPRPSGISHLYEGVALPVLSSLTDGMVFQAVTTLLNPLATRGASWDPEWIAKKVSTCYRQYGHYHHTWLNFLESCCF